MYIYLFYFVENGSEKLIFRKLKRTQANLGFFKGSACRSRELKGLKGTQGNSKKSREPQGNLGFFKGSTRRIRELKGTQRKSRELKGT